MLLVFALEGGNLDGGKEDEEEDERDGGITPNEPKKDLVCSSWSLLAAEPLPESVELPIGNIRLLESMPPDAGAAEEEDEEEEASGNPWGVGAEYVSYAEIDACCCEAAALLPLEGRKNALVGRMGEGDKLEFRALYPAEAIRLIPLEVVLADGKRRVELAAG